MSNSVQVAAAQPLVASSRPTYAQYQATRYFAALDVLRAIAILAVLWHHTAGVTIDGALSQKGYHGVTLFFAISGFLIVTLLLREKSATGNVAIRDFMIKRALRILPLYYATLLIYVCVVALTGRDPQARAAFFENLPYFATFTGNWFVDDHAPRVIFAFAWSLAAEEQFYLVWPWIERARLGQIRLGRLFGLGMAVLAVLLSPHVAGAVWASAEPQPVLMVALSRLPGAIGLGVILAHLLHDPRTYRWLAVFIGRRGSGMMLALAALGVLLSGDAFGAFEPALMDALCMLIVGAAVIRPDTDVAVLARIPGVVHIGVVSYGLYLLHMLSANAVKMVGGSFGLASGVGYFAATLLVALCVASLSHATFERWMQNLRPRLLRSEKRTHPEHVIRTGEVA